MSWLPPKFLTTVSICQKVADSRVIRFRTVNTFIDLSGTGQAHSMDRDHTEVEKYQRPRFRNLVRKLRVGDEFVLENGIRISLVAIRGRREITLRVLTPIDASPAMVSCNDKLESVSEFESANNRRHPQPGIAIAHSRHDYR